MPDWPDLDHASGPLGDGRFATATDRPGSIDELREMVRRRAAEGMAIYPQGGRTALDYGGIPRRPGVAVDLAGLDRVIDYPAADLTITVEAGVPLAGLAQVLDAEGQRLEIDAPEPDRATVGGVFVTNSTGPRRYGWGRPRDQILGVGFVAADGEAVKGGGRVVKNVAGYDFPRLLTGSLGTLGVITHVTLKVRPKPEAVGLVLIRHETPEGLARDLDRLNTSATRPALIELLNAPAADRAGLGPGRPWTLAVGFEASPATLAWQVDRLGAELSGQIERSDEGDEATRTFRALREATVAGPGRVAIVANVRYSKVVPLVATIDPGLWSVQAHAGNGVVRAEARVDDRDAIEADLLRLRAQAEADGGNMIVVRCPADRKEAVGVWGTRRADWAFSERIKAALDPGGVMNPGRFIGTI